MAFVMAGLLLLTLVLLPGVALSADYYQHQQQHQYYQSGAAAARAVPLQQVKALTLYKGRMTAGRRHAGVPQLKCVSGCEYEPDVVQCSNVGSDGVDVQWKCEADLPSDLRFGTTTVSCEGYDYPEDPRVLEGSCGLEYSVRRVGGSGGSRQHRREEDGFSYGQAVKWLLILYILYMAYRVCVVQGGGSSGTSRPRPSGPWGWGGGGPPPGPPPPRPPYNYDDKMGYGAASASAGPSPWLTGAAGMGLGYMMGRRNNAQPAGGLGGGGWGGGGGSSSSRSSSRGSMRSATGYASTSRR